MITKLAFNFSGIQKAKGYVTGQLNKARPSVLKSNKEMANSAQQSMKRLDDEMNNLGHQLNALRNANTDVRKKNIDDYLELRKKRNDINLHPIDREMLGRSRKINADISKSLLQNRKNIKQSLKGSFDSVSQNKSATQDMLNQMNKDIRTGQNIQRGAIAGGIGLGVAGGAVGLATTRKNNNEFQ